MFYKILLVKLETSFWGQTCPKRCRSSGEKFQD